jgi:hypothetical protein
MGVNIADGDDRVAVQVGQVHGRKSPKPAPEQVDDQPGRTENIRTGNARVGRQADVITGDLHISF